MTDYISPILGTIPEETYNYFINRKQLIKSKEQMKEFLKEVKETTGFGVLRTGILFIESSDKRIDIRGNKLELYLNNIGFPQATDITKVFALNQTLIEDLTVQTINIRETVYGTDLAGRLKKLGLIRRTIETKYARELLLTIYPIIAIEKIEEIPPPPPPEILYRSQATFTYSSRKQSTKIEVRIWYQSYNQIDEQELIDKWNEANENAVNLTNEPLLDEMQPSPGFEHNHEISIHEIEGTLDTWIGKLIITRQSRIYEYDIL